MLNMCIILGGHHFLWNRGVMNFRKYGNIFVTPLFDDQKFYDPPLRSYNVEETCNPNARSAENILFGGYFIEQNFH